MAIPSIRWLRGIAIAVLVVVAALALLWASSVLWRQWWLKLDVQTVIALTVLASVPFAVVVAAIWWLWWWLPKHQLHKLDVQIHDPKARADTEDNFRKTVGQALGGAAVLIGAVVAYLQFTQQQRAAHDLLISNQVSKGFEQLAGDKPAMRLGGIYALEGVMKSSPEYYGPLLEALCAFVRDSTTGKANDKPANDVQAALAVIGRRKEPGPVDLTEAHIPGADLTNANLNSANLKGADLSGTDFSDADLTLASLEGAKLNTAILYGAKLSQATLRGAKLREARIVSMRSVTLSSDGFVSFGRTIADLSYADLRGADLTGANLSGADLTNANLTEADLSHTNLRDATLEEADLGDARNLTQDQLDQACGKPKALPPGLTLDKPPCREKP